MEAIQAAITWSDPDDSDGAALISDEFVDLPTVLAGYTINLKKSVEFNPAENIQHKFDKQIGGMS